MGALCVANERSVRGEERGRAGGRRGGQRGLSAHRAIEGAINTVGAGSGGAGKGRGKRSPVGCS